MNYADGVLLCDEIRLQAGFANEGIKAVFRCRLGG
jgi:hypothetical protein